MEPVINPAFAVVQGLEQTVSANESRPCIYYGLSFGALVAATAAVALTALNMMPIAYIFAGLCVIDLLGAYYSPRRRLEDLQSRLERDLPVLKQETVNWQRMLEQQKVDRLEGQRVIERLQNDIKEKTHALEQATEQLRAIDANREKLSVLSVDIKASTKLLRRNSQQIKVANDQAEERQETLERQQTKIQSDMKIIDNSIGQMTKLTEADNKLSQEVELLRIQLAEKEVSYKKLEEKLTKETEELWQKVADLTKLLSPKKGAN